MANAIVQPHARPIGLTTYRDSEFYDNLSEWLEQPELQQISAWAANLDDGRRRFLLHVARQLSSTTDYFPGPELRLSADSYPYERLPVLGIIATRLLTALPAVQAAGERQAQRWDADYQAFRAFTDELYSLFGEDTRSGGSAPEHPDQELLAWERTATVIDPRDYPLCTVRGCTVRCRQLEGGMCPRELWDERHEAAAGARVRR